MSAPMAPTTITSSYSVQRSRNFRSLSRSAPGGAPTTRALGSPSFMESALAMPLPDEDLAEDNADDDEEEEKALMQMRQNVQNTHPYQYKDRTREYRETNYLFQNVSISINAFWLDYLMHENNSPFLSQVGLH